MTQKIILSNLNDVVCLNSHKEWFETIKLHGNKKHKLVNAIENPLWESTEMIIFFKAIYKVASELH